MIKVFVTGNYLIIDDGKEILWNPKKDVSVRKVNHSGTIVYNFHNKISAPRTIAAADIVDSAGVAHADLEAFLTSNTGA